MLGLLRPRGDPAEERPRRALKRLDVLFVVLAIAAGVAAVFWRDCIIDPDCFYHAGHARLYLERGPFSRDFPWAAYSVISRERADLWWGFHVATSPIGLIRDPVLSMRVGIAAVIAAHVLILGLAYRRLGLSAFWALASLTASAGFLSRAATLRPQVLSAALLPWLFAELWRRSLWGSVAAGAAMGFLHPTLGYMMFPIVVVTAVTAGRKVSKGPELGAVGAALLVAIARPGLMGNLALMKVQTVDLFAVKKAGLIQNFGNELTPTNMGYFLFAMLVPMLLVGLSLFLVRRETTKSAAPAAFVLTLIYLGVFLLVTKRGVDLAAPFAVLTFALVVGSWERFPKWALVPVAAACGWSLYSYGIDKIKTNRPITRRFEKASSWIAQNTPENAVIYHTVWSHFADLFFWNRRNRYLGGMDPMFQWAVSPANYWLTTPVHPKRRAGWVGTEAPMAGNDIPLYRALPERLDSKWILCGIGAENNVVRELERDRTHYRLRYSDVNSRVFEVLPEPSSRGSSLAGSGGAGVVGVGSGSSPR